MRWENLERESHPQPSLPGVGEPVVRAFDAPEAVGIRFHEVEARSALNRVPKASRMPFRWTINPYRGCTHACVYCLDGATRVLMADGRHVPIADLRPGDAIYGTNRVRTYRRYVPTRVLAHWETRKRAFRVTLEDGTELVASGDHRFLTNRGWKYVTGTESGGDRRPHLTTRNKLMGVGAFAASSEWTPDYELGYLCGLLRGDGTWGTYEYTRKNGRRMRVHRFRLALTDFDALRRAQRFLARADVATTEFDYAPATATRRNVRAIRTSRGASIARIEELVAWPREASRVWCAGFLAGIFDGEGGHNGVVRITNTDPSILDWTRRCLRKLGLSYVTEDLRRPNGLKVIRLTGGLRERLRFFHTTDPAITRKRTIDGTAIKSDAPLRIVSIEPIGTRDLYDVTTGTGDFIANGVVSHNCFARPTHEYLGLNPREDFEREIVVKVNVPELVRAELRRPSWKREHVALGTNTDPYQWVEGRYRLMEGIWEAMRDFANPCSILTKSPLLLRDLKLMKEIAERTEFAANLSIPTLDEKAWRATEPHTPHPRKRIEAVAELTRAGISTGVLIAPLIPGVNDSPAQVEELIGLLGEAGAGSIGGIGLHLRGPVREIWFDWLRQYRPELVPRYEELFANGAYMQRDERERLAKLIRGRTWPSRFRGRSRPGGTPPRVTRNRGSRRTKPRQTSLF